VAALGNRESGYDPVAAASEHRQHALRVGGIDGFLEDFGLAFHYGVRTQNDRIVMPACNCQGFSLCHPQRVCAGQFLGLTTFFYPALGELEAQASSAEQLPPARRSRCENEFGRHGFEGWVECCQTEMGLASDRGSIGADELKTGSLEPGGDGFRSLEPVPSPGKTRGWEPNPIEAGCLVR
jgi:hypothetical protein